MYARAFIASTALIVLGLASARAADFSEAGPAAVAPPAAASSQNTFSIEFDPEFYAAAKSPSIDAGTLADFYGKFGFAHTFDGGFVVSGFLQTQDDIKSDASDQWRYYAEGDV